METHEVFFALLLIYQFRILERRLGSAKYGAFVLFAVLVAWPLRLYLLKVRTHAVYSSLVPLIAVAAYNAADLT